MKKSSASYSFLFLLPFLVLLASCSQTKNTLMHRGWHNMNARYNGYFYSRENVKETVKRVEKANQDDFTKLIPLFVYPTATTAKTYYADFDKTIKKSSIVIHRHTIMEKKTKKEIPNACRWIDENYTLIGIAHFYKRDFFSALEAFDYVSRIYPKPEAKYTAMLWMIRTNNEIGSLSGTETVLDELRNAKDFPKERVYQRDLAALTADYHIKRGDPENAIKSLTKAITLTRRKSVRARYIYVLAQLYEKQGDNKNASKYYAMVPGLHPSYDMAFSAQIKRARLFEGESEDRKAIVKQLQKMLRDDKNTEFQDQIYYALAEISYREKDVPQAITYLDKSIKESVGNNTQKAMSYLKRADIYFEQANYKAAQANYDSTMSILPKDFPNYEQVEAKKKSLTSLVVNLNVIALEDSLQTLAKMSEDKRNEAIDRIIRRIEDEERLKEEEKANEQAMLINNGLNPTIPANTTSTGAWYFYNPATVGFGIGEFAKRWGSRKLEDNWRRSDKEQILVTNPEDGEEGGDSLDAQGKPVAATDPAKNKKDRAYYLKRIPLTADELAKSNIKIMDAYYNAGSIYKEQLLDNPKSVETFEDMLKRYPENKYKLSVYYQLYRTYLAMKNQPKSDYYKNILVKDYPETEYALLITNPEKVGDIAATKSQVETFYTQTYQLYSEGRYQEALTNCLTADTLYAKSFLMPQFAFLKALSIGRTQDINSFEAALTNVVLKYPKEPVKGRAQEILDMIKKQKSGAAAADSIEAAKPKFVFNESAEYFWVLIVDNGKGDINTLKANISNSNTESFGLEELHVSSLFLDAGHQLVTVKTFQGKDKAMDYFNFMRDKKSLYTGLESGSYQAFIMSADNYTIFYKEKNIQAYEEFFTQNFR
jgi:tetratricopeptide (TPR) repeat protein